MFAFILINQENWLSLEFVFTHDKLVFIQENNKRSAFRSVYVLKTKRESD